MLGLLPLGPPLGDHTSVAISTRLRHICFSRSPPIFEAGKAKCY